MGVMEKIRELFGSAKPATTSDDAAEAAKVEVPNDAAALDTDVAAAPAVDTTTADATAITDAASEAVAEDATTAAATETDDAADTTDTTVTGEAKS